jgi:hypothetical protein
VWYVDHKNPSQELATITSSYYVMLRRQTSTPHISEEKKTIKQSTGELPKLILLPNAERSKKEALQIKFNQQVDM